MTQGPFWMHYIIWDIYSVFCTLSFTDGAAKAIYSIIHFSFPFLFHFIIFLPPFRTKAIGPNATFALALAIAKPSASSRRS
jgi:hypothetical protein